MKRTKSYNRLTMAERISIEKALYKGWSFRKIALSLNRSTSTISNEVLNKRIYANTKLKGTKFLNTKENYCAKLSISPHVCNGCKSFHYNCKQRIKVEYCSQRAQALAEIERKKNRMGVNIERQKFELIVNTIKNDLKRGLSPYQISVMHKDFQVSPNTIYRWVSKGYAGMSALDLRRKVRYKPRKKRLNLQPTKHGYNRSYSAFCRLDKDSRDSAVEMDCVIGMQRDEKCILTLYLRNCKFQFAILLNNKTIKSVVKVFDSIEMILGKDKFVALFENILTDNGTEFADYKQIEQSVFGGKRSKLFYCDVRASQQKGACEKNHVELRKLLPKGHGISFDNLENWDMSVLMSHLNSQPRKSLCGLTPIKIFKSVYAEKAEELLQHFGIEEVPPSQINLTVNALNQSRRERSMPKIY